jgi:hypothetical protein
MRNKLRGILYGFVISVVLLVVFMKAFNIYIGPIFKIDAFDNREIPTEVTIVKFDIKQKKTEAIKKLTLDSHTSHKLIDKLKSTWVTNLKEVPDNHSYYEVIIGAINKSQFYTFRYYIDNEIFMFPGLKGGQYGVLVSVSDNDFLKNFILYSDLDE